MEFSEPTASFLIVIAAFYLSFAAYFGASIHAWQTEVVGVVVFFFCAVVGLFYRPAIAVGYVMHGLWDLSHSLSGTSLAGLSMTEIPLGYGIFCLTYDFTVACYLMTSDTAWQSRASSTFTSGDIVHDPTVRVGTFYGNSKNSLFSAFGLSLPFAAFDGTAFWPADQCPLLGVADMRQCLLLTQSGHRYELCLSKRPQSERCQNRPRRGPAALPPFGLQRGL